MSWCPTMDLIALVTTDSQLMVHRPAGWQRLFLHSGFDHPITCVAWRPDGQVLAVGHADGGFTLFGVEEGEQLGTTSEHTESLSTFCWVLASPGDGRRDPSAKDSPYVCSLAGLFAPLPQLPKQASVQQYLLEEGTTQLDVALYKLLFEAHSSLAFDIAVTADAAARVHLAVHGRFSLGCLQIGQLPALEFGSEPPKILAVKLAPSLHALTVIVQAAAPATSLLPDGQRQEHAPGTLLLAFRTGQLTRAHLEIRALALSYMQCEALASRARAALEAAQRVWQEAVAPLHAKMASLERALRAAHRPGTIGEELTLLLACGVPPPCLHDFILNELREQDLTRTLKGLAVAANAIAQLCISHVHPALEMLVQRLSHLLGLSRWPYQFAALGLQPARAAAALEAAVGLRASAELLLVTVRRSQPELGCFLSWLIRVHRKMKHEAPPTAEEMPPLHSKAIAAFLLDLNRSGGGRGVADGAHFDHVSDLLAAQDGDGAAPTAPPGGFVEDELAALSGLPPTERISPALAHLTEALQACFSPVAQHVSAGFQLHSCTSLDAAPAGEEAPTMPPSYDLLQLESGGAAASGSGSGGGGGHGGGGGGQSQLLLAVPQRQGTPRAERGAQLLLFRARWALQDAVPPVWEACALGGCAQPLVHASFYKEGHLALLHTKEESATTLALRSHAELPFTPLRAAEGGGGGGGGGDLHARVLAMMGTGELPLQPLGGEGGECAPRAHLPRAQATQLALSHSRGMASMLAKGRRVVLLDLEEDEGEEEDEEEGEEEDEGGAEGEDGEGGGGGAEGGAAAADSGSDDDMEEDYP